MLRRIQFPLAAILGVALVVLPAAAGSEGNPTIEAVNRGGGIYGESHEWSPATATVNADGVVTIANNTSVEHGVEWVGGPEKPSCSAGIPVGTTPAARGAHWSGTCTFSKPGTYVFYCTVHGPEMTATITVNPNGTTTVTTTNGTTSTTTTTSSGSGQSANPTAGAGQGSGAVPVSGASLLLGGERHALHIPSHQRGTAVHATLSLSSAATGGHLEAQLLARSAALAARVHSEVRVGKLVRHLVASGPLSISVPLDARARVALHRHGRLSLELELRLTSPSGARLELKRAVLLII